MSQVMSSVPSTGNNTNLWYCAKCTRMISPPGSEGTVTPDGSHLCKTCSPPPSGVATVPAASRPRRPSSVAIKLNLPPPPAAAAAPGASAPAARHAIKKSESDSGGTPWLAIACGIGFVIAAVLGFAIIGHSNTQPMNTARVSEGAQSPPVASPQIPAAAPVTPDTVRGARPSGVKAELAAARENPRLPSQLFLQTDRANIVFADFEGEAYGEWKVEGDAFGKRPASGPAPNQIMTGFLGKGLVNTFTLSDASQGTLTSPAFKIDRDFISFLIAGGNHPNETCINLLIDGQTVRSQTGKNSDSLEWADWNVKDLAGKNAQIQIVDKNSGDWGHICVDQIEFSDKPRAQAEPPVAAAGPSRALMNGLGAAQDNSETTRNEFNASLKGISDLAAAQKYSAALKELADVKTRLLRNASWPVLEPDWTKAESATNQAVKDRSAEAQTAIELLDKAELSAIEALAAQSEAIWKSRSEIQDELCAKSAREVLAAVTRARGRISAAAQEKATLAFNETLDGYEKTLKSRPSSTALPGLIKMIDEAQERAIADTSLNSSILERLAVLRFDANFLKEGEFSAYKAEVKSNGRTTELFYDFSNKEQFKGWTFSDPMNMSSVLHDEKNGNVVIKSNARHDWDRGDRRGTPLLTIPLNIFQTNDWSYEAIATLAADKGPNKADYGILVWDGAAQSARFSLKEHNGRDLQLVIAVSNSKNDNYWNYGNYVAGKTKEPAKLTMTCTGGVLSFTAMTATKVTNANSKIPLGFEPKFAGLFVRNTDDNESSQVVFDNVKWTAIVSKERSKEQTEALRAAAVAQARIFASRRGNAVRIADDEPAGKDWCSMWTIAGKGSDNTPYQCDANGRDHVWKFHPVSVETPMVCSRTVHLAAGKTFFLRFDVSACNNADFALKVRGNEKELFNGVIRGTDWQPIAVSLADFAGHNVTLEIVHSAGGQELWSSEYGHYDLVRISQK